MASENNQDSNTSDASLLVRFQSGEDDASTALYSRYAERLISLARSSMGDDLSSRFDAEDIIQSVFRTFFRRLSEGQYLVPEGDELWKLLLVIALNKVRMVAEYHRAEKRNVASTQPFPNEENLQIADASEILRMTIDEILAPMAEVNRRIIHLRIDGYEIAEITDKVTVSRRTVERVLQSFRVKLRRVLEPENE